jgi:hypothetical protein
MENKVRVLRQLMEKYDLFQQDDEVGMALKDLEMSIIELTTDKNIVYGEELIRHLDSQEWDLAVNYIKDNNGDIVGYNPQKDIGELFEHIRGSLDFREVTQKELNEINKRL